MTVNLNDQFDLMFTTSDKEFAIKLTNTKTSIVSAIAHCCKFNWFVSGQNSSEWHMDLVNGY